MFSRSQENRLPLSLTGSHPARRARRSSLALTLVESKVELLPPLLSTKESGVGEWWGSTLRVSNSFKSFNLVKERG